MVNPSPGWKLIPPPLIIKEQQATLEMKTSESGLCGAEASSSSGGEVGPCTGVVGSGVVECAV